MLNSVNSRGSQFVFVDCRIDIFCWPCRSQKFHQNAWSENGFPLSLLSWNSSTRIRVFPWCFHICISSSTFFLSRWNWDRFQRDLDLKIDEQVTTLVIKRWDQSSESREFMNELILNSPKFWKSRFSAGKRFLTQKKPATLFSYLKELIFAVCNFEIFCGNLILRISYLIEN